MEPNRLDKFYKIQASLYDGTRWMFLFDRRKAINMLNIKKGDKIFDFACGTGLNIPLLLAKSINITGIDFSRSMLNIARKKYPLVTFIKWDTATHKLKGKADKIICTYSLSMIDEWQKTIVNMKKHLKKDGEIVILDFYHQWRGFCKIFYPLFRRWLHKCGVIPEKKIIPFLKQHFSVVESEILRHGYNFIVRVSKIKESKLSRDEQH